MRPRHPHASPRDQALVRRAARQSATFCGRAAPRYQGWLPALIAERDGAGAAEAFIVWYENWPVGDREATNA